ncbi:hypothetical protein HJFPF1_10785 [Paramyrothecium foliicola]|nr:hypothetical protein HJFPF1_10785 [Paramyrothecium foliicola]
MDSETDLSTDTRTPATTATATVTATATATVTATPTPSSKSGLITRAEAGGIGFGSGLGGIIITVVAVVCYFRFYSKPRAARNSLSVHRSSAPSSKPPVSVPVRQSTVLDLLPQPVSDGEIRSDLSSLKSQIKEFVERHFQQTAFDFGEQGEQTLLALATSPPNGSLSWLAALLQDREGAHRVIRSLIARILFKKMHPDSQTDTTLLPCGVWEAYRSFQQVALNHDSRRAELRKQEDGQRLLNEWRRMTGYLLPTDWTISQESRFKPEVDALASGLAVLKPTSSKYYKHHLESLVQTASKLSLKLFREPDQWKPVWESPRASTGDIVVFPGLRVFRSSGAGGYSSSEYEKEIDLLEPALNY